MLTVDRVLEKRRSKIAANRLRNGVPTAARSRWCPSEAKRERKMKACVRRYWPSRAASRSPAIY